MRNVKELLDTAFESVELLQTWDGWPVWRLEGVTVTETQLSRALAGKLGISRNSVQNRMEYLKFEAQKASR